MAASSVVNGLSKVADYLGPYLIKHTQYMISPERYIKELEVAVKELEAAEAKILRRIEDEKMRGYGIEGFVYEWLNEVKGLKERMWKLIRSNRQPVLVEFFNGVVKIPNPGKRHSLALEAVKGMDEVVGCCNKEKTDMTEISYLIHQHHLELGGTNFITLQTHTTLITDVLQKLEEGDGMMIGIYGIRGVGKSTLVRMIEVGARKSGKYAKVEIAAGGADVNSLHASIVNILTEVHVASHHKLATKPPNVHKDEAAGDGDDDEKIITTTKNARPLDRDKSIINKTVDHPTGNNKIRVLIIVHNLSDKIDLATYIVENKNNYKLQFLVTSTSNDLLASINCHPIQQLCALRNPEARQLLTHLIGPDKAAKLGNIPEDQLGKCCAGLPVYIEALARIIKRSNSVNLWDDAVNQLPRNLDSVDTILELTYKQLEDQVKFRTVSTQMEA